MNRNRRLILVVAAGILAGGLAAAVFLREDDDPDVYLTADNALVLRGSEAEVLAEGSARAGFHLNPLRADGYHLVSADVSRGPIDVEPGGRAPSPVLIWRKSGAPFGSSEVQISYFKRVEAAVGGFSVNDDIGATPVISSVPGLELERVSGGGAVAFTARIEDRTYILVFNPPNPTEAAMQKIVEDTAR